MNHFARYNVKVKGYSIGLFFSIADATNAAAEAKAPAKDVVIWRIK